MNIPWMFKVQNCCLPNPSLTNVRWTRGGQELTSVNLLMNLGLLGYKWTSVFDTTSLCSCATP